MQSRRRAAVIVIVPVADQKETIHSLRFLRYLAKKRKDKNKKHEHKRIGEEEKRKKKQNTCTMMMSQRAAHNNLAAFRPHQTRTKLKDILRV
jgi:hypothetical protein